MSDSNRGRRAPADQRAFTIVELLVVIGVIGLLLGLLLPALAGARARSHKTDEMNTLRNLGLAWNMYANSNNDAAIPGYLETAVQEIWKVKYQYPDRDKIPPAPDYSDTDPNIAGPWVWRLMPYLDNKPQVLHAYADDADQGSAVMVSPTSPEQEQERMEHAAEISLHPYFAYNSFYIGGWWEPHEIDYGDGDVTRIGRTRYWDATDVDTGRSVPVVTKAISGLSRSDSLVVFCSAARRDVGIDKVDQFNDADLGFHYVSPPFLADTSIWNKVTGGHGGSGGDGMQQRIAGDSNTIEIFEQQPVPVGRYTGFVSVLYGDGHVDVQTRGALLDQRSWVNVADRKDFRHTP